MNRRPCLVPCPTSLVLFFAFSLHGLLLASADEEKPFGLERRIPWTTSRVIGSPDPPLPYTVEQTFTQIDWQAPMFVAAEPGTDRLLVVQQGAGKDRPSQVLRVRDDPATDKVETLLEVADRLIYAVTFHPDYRDNGLLFVFSNGPTSQSDRSNRISHFTVGREAPHTCDPKSERIIIEWNSAGHDGGDLVFGHDHMLYIATGDGTGDSDTSVTGQDVSDLLGAILRIDVDHPEGEQRYSIPPDNPFVGTKDARDEIWAYGLRNPWRMCVDRKTGHIWVGNNGQDLWETAHLVGRGENYGWSVYEGNHPFYLNRKLGPTPFVPPTIEHHHLEFRSLTGGVVYYGERLADLNGVYVYGDYSTGKIWGARHDGNRLTWHRELADTTLQIAGFAVGHRGELLIVDITGGLYRLIPAPPQTEAHNFPTRLSDTGLFVSVKDHEVQPGVIPYSVNAPGWADGATAERFLALPGESRIDYTSSRGWNFPDGTVLMQTLSIEPSEERSARGHRIETRLLTRQQGEWVGYSYRWNDDQTDATLVSAKGDEIELTNPVAESPGDAKRQTWRFPSRAECMSCHSRAVNYVLGLTEVQMNREHGYGGVRDNQLRTYEHIGLFNGSLPKPINDMPRLVDPYDTSQDLEARARSYLHTNCSVCHVAAGGGNAKMELEFVTARDAMNLISARPQHDTFGINNAMLIAPGDPDRSILEKRVAGRGRGQMPPLVSNVVDHRAVGLIHDWIQGMKPLRPFVHDWKMDDLLPSLADVDRSRSLESGEAAFRDVGCIQCHRFHGEGSGVGPDLSGVASRLRPEELLESMVVPSKKVAPDYATTVIQTTSGRIIEGRIERENDSLIVLRTPESFAEPTTIRKADVEERALSTKSSMPDGMLNSLEKHQVLDLLAYLIADGRPAGKDDDNVVGGKGE